jgi:Kef-type K+ transport system membrane component KefB
MHHDPILFTIFLVFSGAALLATLALYARQSLLVAYILLGVIAGPSVLALVPEPILVQQIAQVGIMFLLFLLGLNLPPAKLVKLLREATLVTLASSLSFALLGMAVALLFGYGWLESLVVGAALMFSSTIIGLKLLPTTVLHHRHTGEVMISILLLQDLLAILVLIFLRSGLGAGTLAQIGLMILALTGLTLLAFLLAHYLLMRLIARFDRIREYIFLVAIGWCLGLAQLSGWLGLSSETGAFIAGVTLATHPVAQYIAESLKPLRDFFLVLFFFSMGAALDLGLALAILPAGLTLAALMLVGKPLIFRGLLRRTGERGPAAGEIGVRLGQVSEFSLIIGMVGHTSGVLGAEASYLIQITTILTFIVSSYWIVLRYPTPIALSEELRRD